jgi:hypothetical protein
MNYDDMQTNRFHSHIMFCIGIVLICVIELVFRWIGI